MFTFDIFYAFFFLERVFDIKWNLFK